jgi:hypothetical protein
MADWQPGSDVIIEYDSADPRLSRVQGTSTGPVAPSVLTAAALLGSLVGLVLAVRRLRIWLRTVHLLRHGQALASDQFLKFCHVDGSRIRRNDLQVNRPVLFEPGRRGTALAVNRLPVEVGPDGAWKTRVGRLQVWVAVLLLVLCMAGGILGAALIVWALG